MDLTVSSKRRIVANIVDNFLAELRGRKGFEEWFDAMFHNNRQEIVGELRNIIYTELQEEGLL